MALVIADRVKESSTTSGTGTITLGGAVSGYQAFTAIGNGNQCYYTIVNIAVATEWEVGVGTYSSSTLTRDTVLSSSNAGAKVSFSAGNKEVFVTYPADRSVSQADIGTAPNEVPLNQYLGSLAYQDLNSVVIEGGTLAGLDIQSLATDISADGINTGIVNAEQFVAGSSSVFRGGATNLLQYSEEFDNAYWPKTASTILANTIVAPDGTLTGDKLVADVTSSSTHRVFKDTGLTISLQSVSSIYIKAGEYRYGVFLFNDTNNMVGFDAQNGTITYTGSGIASVNVTPVGNGWYRFLIINSLPSRHRYFGVYVTSTAVVSTSLPTYTGDGTSGIYIWGAQINEGTTGAYLKTVATAVTTAYAAPLESPNGLALPLLASMTPARNADMTFELASDTSLVVKVKGSDGTVRSATLTLA
jgi:hypothetical protein